MRGAWITVACLGLGACSQAPVLQVPVVPVGTEYKESAAWMPVQPTDVLPQGDWWTAYGDTELDGLQARLVADSPDLAAAYALRKGLTRAVAAAFDRCDAIVTAVSLGTPPRFDQFEGS